jgi:Rieske Fe-S protein
MDRKEFLIDSCTACIGLTLFSGFLGSCKATQFVTGKTAKDGLLLSVNDFVDGKKGKFHSYIIIRNDSLLFPICVYRMSEKDYSALWMQCAHQGAELNVSGNFLQCPAHGSEFDNKGQVTNGPASKNLRTFPVTITGNELFIDLRKV